MRRLVVTEHKSHACGATRGTKWHTIKDTKSGQAIVIESPGGIAHAVRQIAADYGMAVAELVGDEGEGGAEVEPEPVFVLNRTDGPAPRRVVFPDGPPLAGFGERDRKRGDCK